MKLTGIMFIAVIVGALLTGCKKENKPEPVKVTGITLNKSAITIIAGESEQLSVTEVKPDNATEKDVTWSSDNEARATVDVTTGMVSVPATATAGTVNIIATAKDGSGVTATCVVTAVHSYTYEGEQFKVVWAGYFHNPNNQGYCFGISPTVPAGKLFEEENFFEVDYPEDKLGQKLDMSQNCGGAGWDFYGYFYHNGAEYFFADNNYGVSGSNNWVKVTKNSGTDNFTLEFAMTVGDKRLTGNYSGTFTKYDNYEDVGEN